MKNYKDLEWKGRQALMYFDNGYGVSIINDGYGSEQGLLEMAIMLKEGGITYGTGITDDVLGSLSKTEVTHYMKIVQELETIID